MSFLYPGFLFALFAIAIPIVIHLFNFRRYKKVYFSNVKFLKEVEEQHSSKEKLKNLLVLFARILTIFFLVLAFAQPYISSSNDVKKGAGNVVSIYVDNSFSMQATNKDGSLLDEAKRKAATIANGFNINDKFQLLTNQFNGKEQRLLDREEFLNALEEVRITSTFKTLQPIINLQERILKGNANQFIYVLSDFQTNISTGKLLDLRPGIVYNAIKIQPNNLANVAVDSVYFLSPNHQPNVSEKLVVVLKNYSTEVANNIPIKLSINGSQKGAGSLTINAGKSARDTLNFSGLKTGWQKGLLNIKDYPVNFDDSLFFSFNVKQSIPVLALNGEGRGKYISALYGADKYFELTQMPERNIDFGSFSKYKLIILNGIQKPSNGLAQQLKSYVVSGGALIILPYLSEDFSSYNTFLSTLSLPNIKGLDTVKTTANKIDFNHPIYKDIFQSIPKNLNYPNIKRHFIFDQNSKNGNTPIIKFGDGNTAFGTTQLGNGNIYLSATGFNEEDGNLAVSPIFLPLMYKAALVGDAQIPLFYTIGQEDAVIDGGVKTEKNQLLKIYADKFEVIPDVRNVSGRTTVYMADQITNTGFYNLKLADSLIAVFAFNNQRSESDMRYLTKAEIKALAGTGNLNVSDTESDFRKFSIGAKQITHTFWKLCIILALVFMAAEILLIRFFMKISKQTI